MLSQIPDGANAFDFLIGSWQVKNRRLIEKFVGADEWEEFDGTLVVRQILDGLGNVDEYRTIISGRELVASTMRIYNPHQELWSLHWVDNWSAKLYPPLQGNFEGGRGTFYADEEYEGLPIKNRFIWERVDADSASWEQAYSKDMGKQWEVNWIMEFERQT